MSTTDRLHQLVRLPVPQIDLQVIGPAGQQRSGRVEVQTVDTTVVLAKAMGQLQSLHQVFRSVGTRLEPERIITQPTNG